MVLEWEPATCILDVATYQHGALAEKRTGVRSGATLELPPPAPPASTVRTELKIWRPGDELPAHSVWVVVHG